MSSKKIYQQFIRKTASEGKSIVAWDASRRYEGVFKQFDPTGEFVILTNVWVSEGQETIFVSEMLLPLDSLTIVSAGLPVETFEEETFEEFGAVYPAESPPEAENTPAFTPAMEGDTAFTLSQTGPIEKPVSPVEKPSEISSETQPPVESAVSKLINLPMASPASSSEAEVEAAPAEPKVSSRAPAPSAVSSEASKVEEAAVSEKTEITAEPKTASAEIKESVEKKEEIPEEKTAPMQKVKGGIGKLPGFFQKVFQRKPKQEYPQDVAQKIPPTPAYRASQPRRIFPPGPSIPTRPAVPATPPPAAHPQVIQRRSAQVSTSSFFNQPVPSQAAIPKQKVDIGTLILDILIGILTLVVIAIVAMGFLGIKIPSLPF